MSSFSIPIKKGIKTKDTQLGDFDNEDGLISVKVAGGFKNMITLDLNKGEAYFAKSLTDLICIDDMDNDDFASLFADRSKAGCDILKISKVTVDADGNISVNFRINPIKLNEEGLTPEIVNCFRFKIDSYGIYITPGGDKETKCLYSFEKPLYFSFPNNFASLLRLAEDKDNTGEGQKIFIAPILKASTKDGKNALSPEEIKTYYNLPPEELARYGVTLEDIVRYGKPPKETGTYSLPLEMLKAIFETGNVPNNWAVINVQSVDAQFKDKSDLIPTYSLKAKSLAYFMCVENVPLVVNNGIMRKFKDYHFALYGKYDGKNQYLICIDIDDDTKDRFCFVTDEDGLNYLRSTGAKEYPKTKETLLGYAGKTEKPIIGTPIGKQDKKTPTKVLQAEV